MEINQETVNGELDMSREDSVEKIRISDGDGKNIAPLSRAEMRILSEWPARLARALLLSPEPEAASLLPAPRSTDVVGERKTLTSAIKRMEPVRRDMWRAATETIEAAVCALVYRKNGEIPGWMGIESGYAERSEELEERIAALPSKPGLAPSGDKLLHRAAVLSVRRDILCEGLLSSTGGLQRLSESAFESATRYGETGSPMKLLLSLAYEAIAGYADFDSETIEKLIADTKIFRDVVSGARPGIGGPGVVFRLLAFARRLGMYVEEGRWTDPVPRILPDDGCIPREKTVLLTGPTLSGKTRAAAAAADICGLDIFHIEASGLLSLPSNIKNELSFRPFMILVDGPFESGEETAKSSRRLVDFREISIGEKIHPMSLVVFESRLSRSPSFGMEMDRLAARLEECPVG